MFTSIVPLSPERHAAYGWQRSRSYAFAAGTMLEPLVASEFFKAVHAFPIAFRREESGFVPVAVLGLEPGRNLFVGPDGSWAGGYIPSRLRGYPFAQARTEDGRTVLCIDEGSGLLTDAGVGEPLFDENGDLSDIVKGVAGFLGKVEKDRLATQVAIGRLAAAGVIAPWSFPVTLGGVQRMISGLFTVDEAALTGLPDAAFVALRQGGTLSLAYAQLLSTEHVGRLETLAAAHAQGDEQRRQRLSGSFVDEMADAFAFDFGKGPWAAPDLSPTQSARVPRAHGPWRGCGGSAPDSSPLTAHRRRRGGF